jgi:hypothetical protein
MKTLVAVTVFILFVSNAFAAEVSWMYVQHRRYENGRILNLDNDYGHIILPTHIKGPCNQAAAFFI